MPFLANDKMKRCEYVALTLNSMNSDNETWDFAQGWALWKSLITYDEKSVKTSI
ncbi:hypothetical protein ACIQZG_11285 [Lysinibacillus sp. NPDC096418]|uniref:hypothetical protein n=1 Tax=Lysinibacillus sp. NPDC096418 TaxID=3364138 RepID=UPI0037F52F55